MEGVRRNPLGRLPDHTPITLAELHAIRASLSWQEIRDRQEDTIIHSDSMSAIKILAQTKTQTCPEVRTKIVDFALSQRASLATLRWVHSHTHIEGNE